MPLNLWSSGFGFPIPKIPVWGNMLYFETNTLQKNTDWRLTQFKYKKKSLQTEIQGRPKVS